jgi:hypothetical protein
VEFVDGAAGISKIGHQVLAMSRLFSARVLIDQPHLKHYTMHALQAINYITLYCSERTERIKVTRTIGPYALRPNVSKSALSIRAVAPQIR